MSLRRLVRHDDGAGGDHAAHTMADRDLGTRHLRRGGAAHPAHALLQRVHAVHTGMHARKTAAIGVEQQYAAGAVLRAAMKRRPRRAARSPDPRRSWSILTREGLICHAPPCLPNAIG